MEEIRKVRLRGRISTDGKYWNVPKPNNLGIGDIKLTLIKSGLKSYFVKFEPIILDVSSGKNSIYDTFGLAYNIEPKPSEDKFKTTDDFIIDFIKTLNINIKSSDYLNPCRLMDFTRYYSELESKPYFYEIIQDTFDPDVIPDYTDGYFEIWNKWVDEKTTPKPKEKIIEESLTFKSKLKGDFKFNVESENIFKIIGSDRVIGDLKIITDPVDWVFNNNNSDELGDEYTETNTDIEYLQVDILESGVVIDAEPIESNQSNSSSNSSNSTPTSIDDVPSWNRKIKPLIKGKNWEVHAANYISLKEGFSGEAKWDVNHYRMGYGSEKIKKNGRLIDVSKGDSCTQIEAVDTLASFGVQDFSQQIAKDLGQSNWNKLTGYQKVALVSLGYNVGAFYISSRSYGKRIKEYIQNGNMKKAAEEILNGPKTAGGVLIKSLATRRKEEAQLFLLPDNTSIYG